jgi:hypothetical protein
MIFASETYDTGAGRDPELASGTVQGRLDSTLGDRKDGRCGRAKRNADQP